MPDNDTRGRDTTQMLAVLVVLVGLALIVLSSAGVVEFSSAMARLVLGAGIILAAGREAIIALVGGVGGRGGNGGGRGGNEGGR